MTPAKAGWKKLLLVLPALKRWATKKSLPKEQKQKQTNPQPIEKMPIDRCCFRRPDAFQLTLDAIAFPARAQQQIRQREQSAEYMQPVHSREQIKERAVRICGHIDALPRQISPRCILSADEHDAEHSRQRQPQSILAVSLMLQRAFRDFDRDAADQNHGRTQPEHFRHHERRPIIRRRHAHDVRAGERGEQHHDAGNRDPNANSIPRGRIVKAVAIAATAAVLAKAVAIATARAAAANESIGNLISACGRCRHSRLYLPRELPCLPALSA